MSQALKQSHHSNSLFHGGMIANPIGRISDCKSSYRFLSGARVQSLSYFILTVLGFSFWFLMAVPFASHRESYVWLARAHSQEFLDMVSFSATTFRPLAQAASWLGFVILDPNVFPTSIVRQAFLQGSIYGLFVLAWLFIYSAAPQRRLFALVAFVAGGVFFSGYIHLFHIYGIFYVPVMLTLGALLRFHTIGTFDKHEVWFTAVAILLVFWHPFATALFLGFYFGFYLDTFRQRRRPQHLQAGVILLVTMMAIAALVALNPVTESASLEAKLFGFLVSYRTNEINVIASLVAFLMAQLVIFSMGISRALKLAGFVLLSILSVVFFLKNLPLLLLWFGAVLIRLLYLRSWSLFFVMLVAILLPLGKQSGTPIYGLFAIIVATYVTSLGWVRAEKALSLFKSQYAIGITSALMIVIFLVRMGIEVPVVTTVASPLFVERERTYQLEHILAWLHKSDYCAYDIAFAEKALNPTDSVESAITRRNRPPAAARDVQLFWKTVLQCQELERTNIEAGTAIVTFNGPSFADLRPVFEVTGKYAGAATVWIEDPRIK